MGIAPGTPEPAPGGSPQENAAVTRAILTADPDARVRPAGEDLALVNAGAAIYAAGRADSVAEGVEAARSAIADGAAAGALERYVQVSGELAPEPAA